MTDRKADQAATRNDYYRELDALAHEFRGTPAQVERTIRARERLTIRWLGEKPWLAGRGLAETVAACRRAHSASIRRERESTR